MENKPVDTRKDLLKIMDLKKYPNRLVWKINNTCNFSCDYCMNRYVDKSKDVPVYKPEQLCSFFDNTGLSWLIMITGGEPFIYPKFIDICIELEKKHYLQVTTNLSTDTIYDFADRLNPDRVFLLSASFHYPERNNKKLIDDFIDKCCYLKNKGFQVLVNYVAHPATLNRMEEDMAHFASLGISSFAVVLRGETDGKNYPESYTENELNVIKKYLIDSNIELNSAFGKLNYYKRYCSAGKNYFVIDAYGNISRCSTLLKKTGNFYEGNYVLNDHLKPCLVTNCNDGHCGLAAIIDKKASVVKMYFEKRAYNRI